MVSDIIEDWMDWTWSPSRSRDGWRETRGLTKLFGEEWEAGGVMGLLLEECTFANKMRQGGRKCFQHRFELECELALERGEDNSTPLGNQHIATDFQPKNEGWRRSVGIQEEVIRSNASQM